MYKSNLLLRKSCSVHMTVFRNCCLSQCYDMDTIISMMYKSGRKQLNYKLLANIGNSCTYMIALTPLMQLKNMLCSKSIVIRVTFKLRE